MKKALVLLRVGSSGAASRNCAPCNLIALTMRRRRGRRGRRNRRRTEVEVEVEGDEQAAEHHVREVSITDEEWQKRNERRLQLVRGSKATLEYQWMSDMCERGELGTARPSTPDANDRQLSKRKWEKLVMRWRRSLRQLMIFPD